MTHDTSAIDRNELAALIDLASCLMASYDPEVKKQLLLRTRQFNLIHGPADTGTGLYDRRGIEIKVGNVVHWTDGGDDLCLEERIETRWDRIAVVSKEGILPKFAVIDSPSAETKRYANKFCYGHFIYQDTEKYLTIVADSKEEYFRKFNNAGECMRWVLYATHKDEATK